LKKIDDEFVSAFESEMEYVSVEKRVQISIIVKPYIYDTEFTLEDIKTFLCENKTQMVFISSPYAHFFDINGEFVKVPVNLNEF
jgi:hypothetical protein